MQIKTFIHYLLPKIVVLSPVIMHSYVPPRTSGELLTLPEPRDDQTFWTSAVVTLLSIWRCICAQTYLVPSLVMCAFVCVEGGALLGSGRFFPVVYFQILVISSWFLQNYLPHLYRLLLIYCFLHTYANN